ncbi:MAG: hypothetical protein AABX04_06965, partial [Nanoarchaeota archaeon]
MPEEEQHHEHHEHHHEAPKSKSTPLDWWKIIAVVGVILLIASIFTSGFKNWSFSSQDTITKSTLDFVNKELLQGQAAAELTSTASE